MKEPSPYFIGRSAPLFDDAGDAEFVVLDDDFELNLRKYWWTVRKHLGLVLAIPMVLAALVLLHDVMAQRLYTAQATILIQSSAPRIFDQESLGAAPGLETQAPTDLFQKTEYELLKSRSLAEKVIAAEGLRNDAAFSAIGKNTADGSPKGPLTRAWSQLCAWVAGLSPAHKPDKAFSRESALSTDEALVATYLDDLKVTPVEDTQLVKIAFTTPDPGLSARLANAHVREFIHQRIELNAQASEEAERFLEQKLVELKRQLEESELALNNYRRDKDIIPGLISMNGKQDVVLERLNSLSQQLQQAHLKSIALGAQVALIDEGRVNALPAVVESGLIQKLKGELDGFEAQYASMAGQLKPNYPPMQELQAKIDRISQLVRAETASIAASVRAQYSAALRREKALQDELDRQKKFALGLNDAAVRYVILEREADTNRQLYNAVLKRMKDVSVIAGVHASNISLVDPAVAPTTPSSPRKLRDVLFAAALGLMAAIGLAFAMERLDNTLKAATEAQKFLRVPTLGVIPLSRALAAKSESASKLIESGRDDAGSTGQITAYGGYSFMGEAYRSLRAALLLSRAGAPPKSIVITSADAGEGKTVSALNIAVVLAHTSSRVLLIDADLRRPSCHKLLSIKNHRGLTEVLAGTRQLEGTIHATPTPGMFLLSSGRIPPNPAELLASERMRQLLAELAEQYDFLVIDSPPLLPVADAMILGSMADGVVMIVDSQRTPKGHVKEAISRLEQARAKIFGTVLNKAKFDGFGYSYYGLHYYRQEYRPAQDDAAEQVNSGNHI